MLKNILFNRRSWRPAALLEAAEDRGVEGQQEAAQANEAMNAYRVVVMGSGRLYSRGSNEQHGRNSGGRGRADHVSQPGQRYVVLKVRADKQRDVVTVVGTLSVLSPVYIEARGT